jgi:probable F420-dependent oxidoreductase
VRYGLIVPQQEIGPVPADVARYAQVAERRGFTFLNIYDHVLGADRAIRPDWGARYALEDQFHEPFVLYGYLAALTRLELVTGVIILPQRQTALVAKQAAEVDVLTGGRFRLGVGIGWNPVEYEALGVDFRTRAARLEEQVALLRRLWTEESVTFSGRFDTVDHAGLLPPPIQRPIPIWLGGGTASAVVERIGRIADGWMCNTAPGPELDEALAGIARAADAAGRDRAAIGLQMHVRVEGRFERDLLLPVVEQCRALGTTHLAFDPGRIGRTPEQHVEFVEELADLLELARVAS